MSAQISSGSGPDTSAGDGFFQPRSARLLLLQSCTDKLGTS